MPACTTRETVSPRATNLLKKKCIVFITGAGISSNLGSTFKGFGSCTFHRNYQILAVPDFRSLARSSKFSCALYDASAYLSEKTAQLRLLHLIILPIGWLNPVVFAVIIPRTSMLGKLGFLHSLKRLFSSTTVLILWSVA
jgi:hypothetical protein